MMIRLFYNFTEVNIFDITPFLHFLRLEDADQGPYAVI